MKEKYKKNSNITALLIIAVCMGLLVLWQLLFSDNKNTYSIVEIVGEGIFAIICIGLMFIIFKNPKKFFSFKGLKKDLLAAWPIYILAVAFIVRTFFQLNTEIIEFQGFGAMIGLIVFMIFVGIFEEVLFRGIVLNIFLEKNKESKNGNIRAVFVSSFLFGLVHLFNILGGQNYIVTIGQVIYTFSIGIIFGLVYLKTKNLLPCIIAHTVLNIIAMISIIIYPTFDSVEVSFLNNIIEALISIAISIPMFISSYIMYKNWNKKDQKLVEE